MYSKLPNLVLGFHGCTEQTYQKVIHEQKALKVSKNNFDWLGNGVYFWENSYERALEWAKSRYKKEGKEVKVIGAVIDLGRCLNLTDYQSSAILKKGFRLLKRQCKDSGTDLPQNQDIKNSTDKVMRNLDCAVIQSIHTYNKQKNRPLYDSVRGVFLEGKLVYQESEFVEKTHIQLCIKNPNCIKGYFNPRSRNKRHPIP
ncbi:MAG: hypothetical protein ACRC5H_02680 [Treponemataceae bacterium]